MSSDDSIFTSENSVGYVKYPIGSGYRPPLKRTFDLQESKPKYRIIEHKFQDGTLFFLEIKKRFLFWQYWDEIERYSSLKEAEDYLRKMIETEEKQTILQHYDEKGNPIL